jgi:hypothetical protein
MVTSATAEIPAAVSAAVLLSLIGSGTSTAKARTPTNLDDGLGYPRKLGHRRRVLGNQHVRIAGARDLPPDLNCRARRLAVE